MARLQTDDGKWMEIAITQSEAPMREQLLDVDSRFRDTTAEARGRPAKIINQREPRVKVYRGSVESLVAASQAGYLLSRGFTASPTSVGPPVATVCGVETLEGEICKKKLRSERDRINHIRITHADIAPYIISDEDMLRARGKVVMSGRGGVAGSPPTADPRVAVLEAQVAELLALVKKSAGGQVAEAIGADLKEELRDTVDPIAEEFMHEGEEEEFEEPIVLTSYDPSAHTCKNKGRFGAYTPGCPACEFKRKMKESNNGDSI